MKIQDYSKALKIEKHRYNLHKAVNQNLRINNYFCKYLFLIEVKNIILYLTFFI